jgi:hypothetical protein
LCRHYFRQIAPVPSATTAQTGRRGRVGNLLGVHSQAWRSKDACGTSSDCVTNLTDAKEGLLHSATLVSAPWRNIGGLVGFGPPCGVLSEGNQLMRNPALSIAVALEKRPKLLPLRATLDCINVKAFADNKQLQQIDNCNWQVLFGRRGTGKTTLLATYANYIASQFDKTKRASIELNVTDFLSVLDNASLDVISDIELAQIYFADFLEKLCLHLFNVFSGDNQHSKFYKLFQLSDKKEYIQDLVLALVDSTKNPSPTEIGGKRQTTRTRTAQTSVGRRARAAASIGGKLSEKQARLSFEASLGSSSEANSKTETQTNDAIGLTNFKFNYYKTREIMINILKALEISQLFIIIDEWSELDRSATRNIQPFFAELLKKVFWNNKHFVLKLGAVRNQTKLNTKVKNSGSAGLELGADIFELSLDEVYTNPAMNKVKFYEELLFKHLSFCNPDLDEFREKEELDFYGTKRTRPVETFITYIFKSKAEFETLIDGAGGLPRDFVEIFDSIARARDFSVSPLWNMKDVKSHVWEHCVKNKQSNIRTDRDFFGVFEKIITLLQINNSRIILVDRNASRKLLNIIGEFYHKRLLHDVPILSVPALIRPKYYTYSADLGLLYDANLRHMDDTTELTNFTCLDKQDTITNFVLA